MSTAKTHADTIRKTGIFSFFTGLSRFFGLARDMLKAAAFGTGPLAVAFDIAFRIPNLFRNLLAEGALSQSFIPVYEKYKHGSPGSGKAAAGAVISFITIVLLVFSALMMFFADTLIPLFLHGNASSATDVSLTISLTRLLFPFIFFASIVSLFISLLYSHGVYWVGSFGPALMNIVVLAGFGIPWLLWGTGDIYLFSYVTLASAAIQLLFTVYFVHKQKLFPRLSFSFKHPALKNLFVMMLPAVFAASVQEVGQIIDIYLATMISDKVPGAVSALSYSHRLIHLPIGIFGVALSMASLPKLSRLFIEKKMDEFSSAVEFGVRLNLMLLLPSALGLILLSDSIVSIIFERGSFDAESTATTALALRFYAAGILAFSLQKFLLSALYSRQNTLVPSLITVAVLLANIGFALLFMQTLYHGGLALGSSLAAFLGVLLYGVYFRQLKLISFRRHFGQHLPSYIKIIAMNGIMAAGIIVAGQWVGENHLLRVLLLLPLGVLLYFLGMIILKPDGSEFLEKLLRIRKK